MRVLAQLETVSVETIALLGADVEAWLIMPWCRLAEGPTRDVSWPSAIVQNREVGMAGQGA